MPKLSQAFTPQDQGTVFYDTLDNHRVIVERVSRTRQPGSGERYLVRIEHGATPPTETYEAPDLGAVMDYLSGLSLPGLDPKSDRWQLVTPGTARASTQWTDEMPTRALPHEEPPPSRPVPNAEDIDRIRNWDPIP